MYRKEYTPDVTSLRPAGSLSGVWQAVHVALHSGGGEVGMHTRVVSWNLVRDVALTCGLRAGLLSGVRQAVHVARPNGDFMYIYDVPSTKYARGAGLGCRKGIQCRKGLQCLTDVLSTKNYPQVRCRASGRPCTSRGRTAILYTYRMYSLQSTPDSMYIQI